MSRSAACAMRSLAVIQCRESRVVEMTSPKASSYLRQLTAQSGSRGRLTLYKGGSCLLASRRQITQCVRARILMKTRRRRLSRFSTATLCFFFPFAAIYTRPLGRAICARGCLILRVICTFISRRLRFTRESWFSFSFSRGCCCCCVLWQACETRAAYRDRICPCDFDSPVCELGASGVYNGH